MDSVSGDSVYTSHCEGRVVLRIRGRDADRVFSGAPSPLPAPALAHQALECVPASPEQFSAPVTIAFGPTLIAAANLAVSWSNPEVVWAVLQTDHMPMTDGGVALREAVAVPSVARCKARRGRGGKPTCVVLLPWETSVHSVEAVRKSLSAAVCRRHRTVIAVDTVLREQVEAALVALAPELRNLADSVALISATECCAGRDAVHFVDAICAGHGGHGGGTTAEGEIALSSGHTSATASSFTLSSLGSLGAPLSSSGRHRINSRASPFDVATGDADAVRRRATGSDPLDPGCADTTPPPSPALRVGYTGPLAPLAPLPAADTAEEPTADAAEPASPGAGLARRFVSLPVPAVSSPRPDTTPPSARARTSALPGRLSPRLNSATVAALSPASRHAESPSEALATPSAGAPVTASAAAALAPVARSQGASSGAARTLLPTLGTPRGAGPMGSALRSGCADSVTPLNGLAPGSRLVELGVPGRRGPMRITAVARAPATEAVASGGS